MLRDRDTEVRGRRGEVDRVPPEIVSDQRADPTRESG